MYDNCIFISNYQLSDEGFFTDDIRGEDRGKILARRFDSSEFERLVDFRTRNASFNLIRILHMLPTTTSECERGFLL